MQIFSFYSKIKVNSILCIRARAHFNNVIKLSTCMQNIFNKIEKDSFNYSENKNIYDLILI